MKRQMITRKKFYDVRRTYKTLLNLKNKGVLCNPLDVLKTYNISITTFHRIFYSRNFKEYKTSGNVYGKGVKSLRKRVLFILGVLVVVLSMIVLR